MVYEIPQTRERIRGRDALPAVQPASSPATGTSPRSGSVAEGGSGVCWFGWRVGDESADAVVFLTVDADGLVTEVTDFWPEPYEPADRP